ncbi:MAG TPA: DUF2889 domain-containing protein [Acidimicrobiales bacterium]|jgi:hypothetical protein|nr:DUF2889 domain-containing protein [Acidimicrobiales bacterium]
MAVKVALHPRHGPHQPTTETPARLDGSVRRTTSIDMLRPEGPGGPLQLQGRGRDMVTGFDGAAAWRGKASFEAEVDYMGSREVRSLVVHPDDPRAGGLVGISASSGFRGALDRSFHPDDFAGSLLYALLDDLPVATLVSGYALSAAGHAHPRAGRAAAHPDICAGWVTGGTIMGAIDEVGRNPVVTGPPAPRLDGGPDPLAWHAMDVLPAHGMRRRRRLDVSGGEELAIQAMFRDSHVAPDGRETVVHEYTLAAAVDRSSGVVLACRATAQVLPWVECPAAADSATRVVGRTVADLRSWVRSDLAGVTTCTHLNDMLRSLADVGTLSPPTGD